MDGDDNPNWSEARTGEPHNCIYLDKNIYVSDGTVKLMVFREPANLDTGAGPWILAQYTSSILTLPYTIGGQQSGFNAGRFEARIKMPTFKWAHSTMWLWDASGVNEIDIVKAYGTGKWVNTLGDHPRANFSTHSHPPDKVGSPSNPYGLTHHEWGAHHYPPYGLWYTISGTYLNINNWQTYACEWDSTQIRFYLDDNLVKTVNKYYQTALLPFWVDCTTPLSFNYNTTPGFPYLANSNSQLRFTTWVDNKTRIEDGYSKNIQGYEGSHEGSHPEGYLGEMEIDYVKIWQRNLHNGWTDITSSPAISINGPEIVCSTATYTAINATSTGFWEVAGDNLQIVASNNSSVTIK